MTTITLLGIQRYRTALRSDVMRKPGTTRPGSLNYQGHSLLIRIARCGLEIGAPGNVIDSADAPEFCRRSIDAIADCPDVFGVTWCCSHRIPSTFSDFRSSSTNLACSMWTGLSPTLARRSETQSPPTGIRLHRHARQRCVIQWMNRATRSCELLKLRAARSSRHGRTESSGGERPCVITSLDAGNPAKLANQGIVRLEARRTRGGPCLQCGV